MINQETRVAAMTRCFEDRQRSRKPRRECARDSVGDVDPMNIDVRIGDHSEAPLEHWQDRLKEKRHKRGPRSKKPETPNRPPTAPDALIDDYAAPPG
jgi:hypothetical protein